MRRTQGDEASRAPLLAGFRGRFSDRRLACDLANIAGRDAERLRDLLDAVEELPVLVLCPVEPRDLTRAWLAGYEAQ